MNDAHHDAEVAPSGPDDAHTIGALQQQQAAAHGDRPALTFYDDATGERTELSHATLDNWVVKTANLLTEELRLSPGDTLGLRLGTHWTTLAIMLAAWRAGLVVALTVDGRAAAAAVAEDLLGDRATLPERLLLVGAGPAGRLSGDAGAAIGYAEEVPAFPDDYDDPTLAASAEALHGTVEGDRETVTETLTHAQLLTAAAQAVAVLGLGDGERLLSTAPLDTVRGLVVGPLACLMAGAGLVVVSNPRAEALAARAEAEHCAVLIADEAPAHPRTRRVSVTPAADGAPGLAVGAG